MARSGAVGGGGGRRKGGGWKGHVQYVGHIDHVLQK